MRTRAPQTLDDARLEEIRAMRAQVHAQLPELVPFLKAAVDEGLVDGWRALKRVRGPGDPPWPVEGVTPRGNGYEFCERKGNP